MDMQFRGNGGREDKFQKSKTRGLIRLGQAERSWVVFVIILLIFRYYLIANDFARNFLYDSQPNISYIFVFTETLFPMMFSINQIGIILERVYSTIFSHSYERQGYVLTVLIVTIPVGVFVEKIY